MTKKVLIILLSLFATSCFDLFQEPDLYFSLKTRLRKISDFKVDSYWIYHCDSLNTNDTITVVSYKKEKAKEPYDSHYHYCDYVVITLKSSYWNSYIKDILQSPTDYLNNYERSYSENRIVGTIGFVIEFTGENGLRSQFGDVQYLNNYNFNGKVLNQVIYHYTKGGRHLSCCEYFFAPDFGLIKMRIVTDSLTTEWNLIEYSIVK